jgi:hypothetical protein
VLSSFYFPNAIKIGTGDFGLVEQSSTETGVRT